MFSESEIIGRLSGVTREEVLRDLERVREAKVRLELEEQLLSAVLDLLPAPKLKFARDPDLFSDSKPDLLAQTEDGKTLAIEVKKAAEQRASKRAVILAILEGQPEKIWKLNDIEAELVARGIEMRKENLRMTLRRMAKAEELGKVADGRYRARPSVRPGDSA